MGGRMAAHILAAGHRLTVWNRTAERAQPLVERGATSASTPADAVAGAEVVITMLADPGALAQVSAAYVPALHPTAIVVDMSTVGPDAIRSLRERIPSSVEVVDAPVLGSRKEAENAELHIFVGGSDDAFARLGPVLGVLGQPLHAGPLGAGAAAKLVANSTLFATIAELGEALALADGLGLEREIAWEVLATTALGPQAERRRSAIEDNSYPPRFPLRLALKDAQLVAAAADEAGVTLRIALAARDWLADAAPEHADDDYSAVLARIIEQ